MTSSIENIVQHLFHQPSLQYVSVDELQLMTQEYPSFAAARFLLLKKMQETDHPGFTDQLHKTTVYFNNPLWLQLLLAPPPHERAYESAPQQERERPVDEAPVNETPVFDGAPAETAMHIEPVHTETPLADDPLFQEVLDRLRFQIQEAGEQQMPEPEPQIAAAPTVPVEIEEHIPEITTQEALTAADEVSAETAPEPAAQGAEEQSSFKIIIETPSSNHDVLFEPYHTIDYFASQGIKLDKLEPQPQDKLGRQLKSFTEWLKSMKKLPQVSIEQVLAENEESAVVASASHSVVGKDIITEAMAEVFEKQGLHYKAAEVYNKLSLLNPSKSAYFADKINALKR
jgi:hypothetical protein